MRWRWLDTGQVPFCVFMDQDKSNLDRTCLVNKGFIFMAFWVFMSFCVFTFVFLILCWSVFVAKICILEIYEHFCFHCFRSCWCFQFSGSFGFLVPSQLRNHRKSFQCHRKYFGKENFVHPLLEKLNCRNKTGNPKQAVLLHLAHSGSQPEHRIHCTSCLLTVLKVFTYFLQNLKSGNHVLLLHLLNKHFSIEISHNRPLFWITKDLRFY